MSFCRTRAADLALAQPRCTRARHLIDALPLAELALYPPMAWLADRYGELGAIDLRQRIAVRALRSRSPRVAVAGAATIATTAD